MVPSPSYILTINGGSSSIKFALFEANKTLKKCLEGKIKRIGLPDATLQIKSIDDAKESSSPVKALNYKDAVDALMEWIEVLPEKDSLIVVGHRIVHGGPHYSKSQPITTEMIRDLHEICPVDPEHMPEELLLIEAIRLRFPYLPQWACFDTAFHRDMPRVAKIVAIPRRFEALGVHRYGFHGLSYEFLMQKLAELAGVETAKGRIILAHLGNGASLAAVHHGRSIDTTMGFTPTAGVPMSCRSGDLDPGLVGYLARTQGFDANRFHVMANEESGLLGISETSSDMQDLLNYEKQDIRAAEAIALFCYQIKKSIGAFSAALGGIDTLVFAGGIGENAPTVRSRICEGLDFLGIKIEDKQNKANEHLISMHGSRVAVRVIPTDEELMIATTICRGIGIQMEGAR